MKKIISFFLVFLFFISNNLSASDKYSDLENKIFKNLRCLICQGQSIYDSQSDFSESMKIVVRKNLQEGMSEKEIYNEKDRLKNGIPMTKITWDAIKDTAISLKIDSKLINKCL